MISQARRKTQMKANAVGNDKDGVNDVFPAATGNIKRRAGNGDQTGHQIDKQRQNDEENQHATEGAARNPAAEGEKFAHQALGRFFLGYGIILVAVNVIEFRLGQPFLPGGNFVEPEPEDQPEKARRAGAE